MYESAYNTIPIGVTVQILHACQLAYRRWISSEEETEEILLENVLWKENAEATLGHRAEPRQLEAGGAARGGGAVQEGD